MPIISIDQLSGFCRWGLWEIQESVKDLEDLVNFSLEDIKEYQLINNETKELEWLAGKLMLRSIVESCSNTYFGIYKDSNGKPYLNKLPYHISVTHSNKFVACIINDQSPVGIDIEKIKPKVLNVRSKFLSIPEIETAGEDLEVLTKYWCSKEALYKLLGKKGVIFSKDIMVDFHPSSSICKGFITFEGELYKKEITLTKIEDYIIALAL